MAEFIAADDALALGEQQAAQQLGHAPRLGDAAAGRERRLSVEYLAYKPNAIFS